MVMNNEVAQAMTTKITVSTQITLEFKQGDVPDTEKLLSWIQHCLNCNTNRVEVKVEPANPVVIANMEGGIIQSVESNVPVTVIVLDADIEGVDESDIVEVDGYEVYPASHHVEIDPDGVADVQEQLVAAGVL